VGDSATRHEHNKLVTDRWSALVAENCLWWLTHLTLEYGEKRIYWQIVRNF